MQKILLETQGRVGLIRLNRPQVLNALDLEIVAEIGEALAGFEADPEIGCIVITGNERAFAAGADIAEMRDLSYLDVYQSDLFGRNWNRIRQCRKPIIAAVAGYALGGGCELAMACDMIFAADNAQFGQPEIKLGTLPAVGGSQRLPRAVGKAKAMDLCLTGRTMNAREAEQNGLVARIYPLEKLLAETLAAAEIIAGYSLPVVVMIKESVNRAYESSLEEGLLFERRTFQSSFALDDRREGMSAFLEKRPAQFKNS